MMIGLVCNDSRSLLLVLDLLLVYKKKKIQLLGFNRTVNELTFWDISTGICQARSECTWKVYFSPRFQRVFTTVPNIFTP
jgi:hypothetical protein